MHAVLEIMIAPVLECSTPWRLNGLCQGTGLSDMRKLPHCQDNYYRWMLGACEDQPTNPSQCIVRPKNQYPPSVQIPDDYAIQLKQALQPGVNNLFAEHGPKNSKK